MLSHVNYKNISSSFWIGIIIGCCAQVLLNYELQLAHSTVMILSSGAVGLVIGTITELITAFLPVSIAKPKIYFLINNLIGILVTVCIILATSTLRDVGLEQGGFTTIVSIAVSVISIANAIDFYRYKKSNHSLKNYQNEMQK